jgi:hypothetical protein
MARVRDARRSSYFYAGPSLEAFEGQRVNTKSEAKK